MSTTQKLYATAFAFLDYANQGSNVHTGDTQVLKTTQDAILIKFDELPSSLRYKRIMAINAYVYAINVGTYRYFSLAAEANTKNFDEETETFKSWGYGGISAGLPSSTDYKELPGWLENTWEGNGIAEAATHGILIRGRKYGSTSEFKDLTVTTGGANKPYIDVIVDESITADTLSIASLSPKSGSINKAQPNVFTWAVKAPYACVPKLEQCSAVFRWRTAVGAAERTINVTGSAKSVTVPAGTFTGTSIQWRVEVTANSGKVTTSDWITLSTADATSTATAQSPKGEIVDASAPVVFKWSHIVPTGTAQTKAELQISTDMQTWTALATVTGAATTYTAPANTMGSGTKYWRVRTYNADNIAGTWSDAAGFICVGAPAAPAVSIKAQSPRPVIGWQSSEQLAYQVEIDGVYSSGTYYGTDKTWTAPMYLEDGEYIVRVRVQNEYALWSPWGTAALQVTNTPTAEITLTVEGGAAARLTWSTAGNYAYDFYLVYRNGTLIAKTTERTYTDLRSIGSVSYKVRGCLEASSNYRMSNTAAVTVSVPCVTLFDLDTGEGLPLPYSDSAHRTTGRSISRGVQTVQLAGRRYPIVERSVHYAETISVACVFREAADCAALEALVGRMIAVKTPEGKLVSGCLALLAATTDGGYYTKYQFDVEQTDTEEVVDIDA